MWEYYSNPRVASNHQSVHECHHQHQANTSGHTHTTLPHHSTRSQHVHSPPTLWPGSRRFITIIIKIGNLLWVKHHLLPDISHTNKGETSEVKPDLGRRTAHKTACFNRPFLIVMLLA